VQSVFLERFELLRQPSLPLVFFLKPLPVMLQLMLLIPALLSHSLRLSSPLQVSILLFGPLLLFIFELQAIQPLFEQQ
jgi:hypothetical protein